eukprot:3644607-Prorocentrum_lima.AAC.1
MAEMQKRTNYVNEKKVRFEEEEATPVWAQTLATTVLALGEKSTAAFDKAADLMVGVSDLE